MARENVTAANEREQPAQTPARDRPDPRPARLMMGAGALAAVTIIGAGLVDFPPAAAEEPLAQPAATV
ncbi:MAG: hypothetical protein AB1Z66_02320, partial [Candidatus Limnocylindrales bacterium]